MHIFWRSGCRHHYPGLYLHLFHLYQELLVGVLLHSRSHYKSVFEEFVLLKEFLIAKSFLDFQHSLLLFFVLGPFLDYVVCIFPRISLQLMVEWVAFVFKHLISQGCVWLVGMVIVPESHIFANVLLQLDLLFLPLFI